MNRLQNEKSPYLLQHASNPVDWYPWCEEAFEKAKKEDKPVFLSIGYSTCHWCHVMERESFQDNKVAELLNQYFVSIKVDREERPDIDAFYMTVCQALTGRGGWPLSIFMTPEKEPFLAATYIPKDSRFGMIGLTDLVPRLGILWKSRKTELFSQAHKILTAIEEMFITDKSITLPDNITTLAFEELKSRYDKHFGGFGTAPKFPSLHSIVFLLRYYKSREIDDALEMVKTTLRGIYHGGIHDHLGGGFHRYSTDRMWILPHFEKMLYDQAMAIWTFTETYKASGEEYFKEAAKTTIEFIIREMTSPDGVFYTAFDADSEGQEGRYYLWERSEILDILGSTDGEVFCRIFNIKKEGNFREENSGSFTGKNVLYLTSSLDDMAEVLSIKKEKLTEFLKKSKKTLLTYRQQRIPPLKDEKILTDMNALTIAALCIAHKYLNNRNYLSFAEKATDFIFNKLIIDGTLYHSYFNGKTSIKAFLDDHAYFIFALLELFEVTSNIGYLQKAVEFTDKTVKGFLSNKGGFHLSQHKGELPLRTIDAYDGAIPSGNSIMAMNLLRLFHLTGNSEYEKIAESIFRCFASEITQTPSGFSFLMSAYEYASGNVKDIVITGADWSEISRMVDTVWSDYNPFVNIIAFESGRRKDFSSIVGYLHMIPDVKNINAFICSRKACSQPILDEETLTKALQNNNS
jgi:hypothetical protein